VFILQINTASVENLMCNFFNKTEIRLPISINILYVIISKGAASGGID